MKRLIIFCVTLVACSRAVYVGTDKTDNTPTASAQVMNATGQQVATATFVQQIKGVKIDVVANGLTPGAHGIHIHTTGSCDATGATAYASAGGHFNPFAKEHGLENPNGAHGGDMPNINIGSDGKGELHYVDDRIMLSAGMPSLFDSDGSALVIHAGKDDQMTDPAGNSGARIACGVIHR
jgi:Cu-Zn family superoxide dismutase